MKRFGLLLMVILFVVMVFGCTKQVPPGYIGMIITPDGVTGEVLQPGNHTCWGRDRLVIIETAEAPQAIQLAVLCADDLNFKFDDVLRVRLRSADGQGIKALLERQGSKIGWGVNKDNKLGALSIAGIYDTFVRDSVTSISRTIVSEYETTQIRANRTKIEKAILAKSIEATKGTPVEIVMLATSNFDYPDVITKAVEKKRTREIQIQEEKAKQAMALLQAENKLKIAQKMKIVRTAEAEAEAAFFAVMGKQIGITNYIHIREIEAQQLLYSNTGKGDKLIVTNGTGAVPLISTK